MARTVAEIKQEIGKTYMQQPEIQSIYGISNADIENGFDATFSKVSIESLLFYAVAFTVWTFEKIMDLFRTEIQTKIDGAVVASKAWWHAQALNYQEGYPLTLNPSTFTWEYATLDPTKQIVKRVAVRESVANESGVSKVKLIVAMEDDGGAIIPLPAQRLLQFEHYAQMIKPAGVKLECISNYPQNISLSMTVYYNPLVLNSDGALINNPSLLPVVKAALDFVKNINTSDFGGRFYISKFTDAIQQAEGVIDVGIPIFGGISAEAYTYGYFESPSGAFNLSSYTFTYSALMP